MLAAVTIVPTALQPHTCYAERFSLKVELVLA